MSTLFGIGVGPGDPELVTLKAARLIGSLPVLAHIGADGRPSRARAIAAGLIRSGTLELTGDMPMRCAPQAARPVYEDLSQRIERELRADRSVGFLCEGDPLLYGSFVAILDRLGARVPVTIVPGITSIAAAAAWTRHVLALRDEVLAVLPATAAAERLEAALASADSVAILKVGRHLPHVRSMLARSGMAERARIVAEVGGAGESIIALNESDADRLPYFSLILARRPRDAR